MIRGTKTKTAPRSKTVAPKAAKLKTKGSPYWDITRVALDARELVDMHRDAEQIFFRVRKIKSIKDVDRDEKRDREVALGTCIAARGLAENLLERLRRLSADLMGIVDGSLRVGKMTWREAGEVAYTRSTRRHLAIVDGT